ncbi:MAG TPA: hypothetical protein VFM29_02490 [Vicinamibacteria bacterium]|nr:hypothetical protein [Vicinamibacteria bacterium]
MSLWIRTGTALSLAALFAPASALAQGRAAAAAAAAVEVAGVRIIGPGYGEDGTELRAFNESPGLALALAVKAPGKTGIVDIDEDKCSIETVTDDKGTNLMEEARFGSFPKVSKDGSVGMVDLEVRVRPAAGSSMVKATGSLVYMAATGTKPVKAKVGLENGKTFKIGTTTVTVDGVTVEEGRTNLTFKLPKSTMLTIKDVRFLDDAGQPLEGNRMGSGWMNDQAEMSFALQTAAKTATFEFDVWQGVKENTVPFTVQAGLGLK